MTTDQFDWWGGKLGNGISDRVVDFVYVLALIR